MKGSWPWLAAGSLVFFAGFVALRSQSSVLRAERDQDLVRSLSAEVGVRPSSALALRALSLDLEAAAFAILLRRFASLRAEFGGERMEPLAAVAVLGRESAARAWVAEAGGGAEAYARRRGDPDAVHGVAFEQLQKLFAMRPSGRVD